MRWFLKCLKQYADFKGRARRREYWMFYLFCTLIITAIVLAIMFITVFASTQGLGSSLVLVLQIVNLLMVLPYLAVTVRRLHDVGKSGWMWFIQLIPLIGGIWLLVLLVTDSQPGTNKYGPNPKGVEAT